MINFKLALPKLHEVPNNPLLELEYLDSLDIYIIVAWSQLRCNYCIGSTFIACISIAYAYACMLW